MSKQQFEWTQPIGGKKVVWRPLTVGDHMDMEANYKGDSAHLRKFAEMSQRIIRIGDGDGPQDVQIKDLREWDEVDFIEFKGEVESRELARMVALAPQRPGGVVAALEQVVNKMQVATNEMAQALSLVLVKAKEAEQKLGPLK